MVGEGGVVYVEAGVGVFTAVVMSPLHLPPLLVRHLAIPVQVPGGEGDLIRVTISVLDIRVVLL